MMHIVFLGTPDYVLPVLDSLHEKREFSIVAVVTQNPKPVGRKKVVTHSPVNVWAGKNQIPVFYNSTDFLKSGINADVGILAALHEHLPKKMLDYFPHGILNIHLSLLPKYRRSSCVQAAIVSGDKYSGATIIKLDEKLDHGPIVSQFKEKILPTDTTGSLRKRLFEIQSKTFPKILTDYISGKIKLREQDHSQTTYANMLRKEDAFIPPKYLNATLQGTTLKGLSASKASQWKIPFIKNYSLVPSAYFLGCFIRAMQPWPVAWTLLRLGSSGQAKRLKILKAHVGKKSTAKEKSKTKKILPSAYCLVPDLVQLEGKKPVTWNQFKKGYPKAKFES
ncbi:methionyl-tRNA formyltransferase [Patescibacteria group bacterium]|nr:methionyl-tRNA formyltransferase [Patescibacteria group bacterium]